MENDAEKSDNSESDRTERASSIDIQADGVVTAAARTMPRQPAASASASEPHPAQPDQVPDGGLTAWLQVLGSAAILVNTWGVINTFGVFQAYYETEMLKTHSSSEISWIGSAQGALLFLVGVLAGPLYDAGYFRELLLVGLFLIVLGQFMVSLCTTYWQVFLSQGLTMGIGMGLTFLPSAAILAQYFSKRRALALGIASAGSPVSGTVFPIIFSQLQQTVGFGWATRTIAFILLGTSIIPIAFMRTRVPPTGKARAIIDKTALRDAPYLFVVCGGFFAFLGLYVTFFYITLFATSHGAATESFAPYLVTLLNAGSIVGRLIPNALADRWGSLNVLAVCSFASAILVFGWLGIHNTAGAVVYAVLYGGFSGGVVSIIPSVMVTLSPDMGRVGTRMGMAFLVSGVAILTGTPIAGAILGEESDPDWLGTILYSAFALLVATLLYMTSRALLYKKNGKCKA
ncbi:MFS general substrate transporter [Canariomyces notabilis]|uniref:MFS general substrate transporter n=1 Tax=Canariomyces notabilis TaxID=2074819 RepID=A0AAN6YWP0_9PEZI|nr:MFS general substrate transporter [Canariomyces arenarius]